ncbi:Golgi membrane protein 1 isoform X2 [Fundulus heteroclitus]|uniref:Golgi membrane protein 1 isoform X2 n=1 Tax=Fundulus heteroclitus TaxID=8078 RepID=UPI00165C4500|nr:Golgi membrane protein 1 isoform X2 [Fundulus heteroclitus]
MGGLGNGRRGGRAPTLMVAALIACILVLGFNYWVSSAHNLELQTKLNELEDRVRRGAAERGEAEMKKKAFQEQIGRIESVHRKELDDVRNTHSQEKAKLLENISSMTKTIEELKGQLNRQNEDLRKLQKELQSCKADTSVLNNKLTVDMAHCQSQVLSQKKLCDEKVAAVKLEAQKNAQKVLPVPADPAQKNAETGDGKEDPTVKAVPSEGETTAAAASQNPNIPQGKRDKPSELLTNDIDTERDFSEQPPSDELPKVESQTALSTASDTRDKPPANEGEGKPAKAEATPGKGLTNNLTGDGDIEVMDVHEDGAQTEADPGMEDMLIGQGKPDTDADQKLEEADEYDTDEHVVGGADLEKEQRNRNMEEEMADYNGDDENEGEFEADKQAALAQI